MMIDRITYKRLVSLGGFNNESMEVSAAVEPGDEAEEVGASLILFLKKMIPDKKNVFNLREEIKRLSDTKTILLDQIFEAQEKWSEIKPVLMAHGIEIEESNEIIESIDTPSMRMAKDAKVDLEEAPFRGRIISEDDVPLDELPF